MKDLLARNMSYLIEDSARIMSTVQARDLLTWKYKKAHFTLIEVAIKKIHLIFDSATPEGRSVMANLVVRAKLELAKRRAEYSSENEQSSEPAQV